MDQVSSLSDLLFKDPAVSGVLLPPASNATGEDAATEGVFSTLVSEAEAPTNPPLAENQDTAALPPSPLPLSSASDDSDLSMPALPGQIGQSSAELLSSLHKILAVLRSGKADVSALAAETAQMPDILSSPISETPEEGLSAIEGALTPTQADQLLSSLSALVADLSEAAQIAGDSEDSSEAKSFSDVIAKLLALTQFVVQTFQQAAEGGGTDLPQEDTALVADLLAETLPSLPAETLTAPGLLALQPADTSVGGSLLDLLKTAAADAKQVLAGLTQVRAADNSTETANLETSFDAVALETTTTETTPTLAQIGTDIKAALVALKEKAQNAQPKMPATKDILNTALAEAAQGTARPFRTDETEVQAAASLPTVAAQATEPKAAAPEKTKPALLKTENLPEAEKPAVPSVVPEAPAIAVLSGGLKDSDFSSEPEWKQGKEKGFSFSGIDSNPTQALRRKGPKRKASIILPARYRLSAPRTAERRGFRLSPIR